MFKYLILDTNILYHDFNLQGNDLRKIIKIASLYNIQVCIPQIVIDECLGQYERGFSEALVSLEKSYKTINDYILKKYNNKINIEKIANDINKKKDQYAKGLKKFINDKDITVIPYCKISHQDIVKAMYDVKHPFTKEGKERGYKDFLLTMSVIESIESIESQKAIIYTNNLKDFSLYNNKDKFNNLHPDYKYENCYISNNLPLIIKSLHDNNKEFQEYSIEESEINEFIEQMVSDILNNILHRDVLYNELFFEPEISKESIYSRLINKLSIEHDKEFGTFTISGKIAIEFSSSFEMNNYMFESYNDNFIFKSLIRNAIANKGHDDNSEWHYKFHDVYYKENFEFTYDLFESEEKPLSEYKDYALTLHRLDDI